jgi:CPA1 family monovalent cation:H+ antiporter
MDELLLTLILVLGIVGVVGALAQRIAVPAPVLLTLAGMLWSSLPALPTLHIEPHWILAVFLPPLLYADAWAASWVDFRRWLRPILQLAIGLVAFTIAAVGVVAHQLLPGLPWAACFLLGGVVSPTDTVAVQSVLDRLRVPRRTTAILGGEGLVNDATGLLGVGLATAVVLTGVFESGSIGLHFARIAGLGVAVGVGVGFAAALLNRRLRGTQVLFAFSLLAPYVAFFAAESVGASGVLAVVIAGFVASWRVHYIAPESRVDLYSSWDQLSFLLNAVMFLYIGLETPPRLREALETVPGITGVALAISAAVVLTRVVWILPLAYLPLWLSPRLRRREGGYPEMRAVVVGAWCGARGAISLAAALSLPVVLRDGTPFPGRAEIVACTLVVIVVTLIGQGGTLLPLVRRLGLSDAEPTDAEVRRAREAMLAAGIARLDAFCSEQSCPIAVHRLREAMTDELAAQRAENEAERMRARERLKVDGEVRRAIYQAQTDALLALRDQGVVNDSIHQELQLQLDRASAALQTEAG